MHEFQDVVPVHAVTAIVVRLSRNGTVSLAALAELARAELCSLRGATDPEALLEAIAPAGGG